MELDLVKWLIFSVLGGFVWFIKRTLDTQEKKLDTLFKDQQIIREEYLHKTEFKEFKTELRWMFEDLKKDINELRR